MEDRKPTEPILDVTDYPESPSHRRGQVAGAYDKTLCQDNKPLTDFINKCICLDPTIEMERIINIVLLPAYCNADNEYKKSDKFKKVITKAFQRLKNDPDRKYNHICGVFETLKVHNKTSKKNKRVDIVELSTTVSDNDSADTDWGKRVCAKKSELEIIDLENDDDDEIMAVDNPEVETADDMVKTENNDLVNGNTIKIEDTQQLKIDEEMQTNEKAKVNNLTVNTPGVATVNNNALHHNKTPKKKKRVNLITLSTTVSAKPNPECRKRPNDNKEYDKLSPKKPKLDFIKLVSDDDDITEVADDEVNDYPIEIQDSQEFKIEEMQTSAKTNVKNSLIYTPIEANVDVLLTKNNDNIIEIQDSQELKTDDVQNDNTKTETNYTNSAPNETEEDKENLEDSDNLIESGNKLLVPQLVEVQVEKKDKELDEAEKARMIMQIEAAIAKCKEKISELELAEVDNDTEVSPYIQCHKLEARIVKLHNDWLDLVEAEPAKRREVRLKVSEGHPEGPIRRLEAFLNEQVDEEGVAPFPDFIDVVRCVKKANSEDGLGWSKPQIMSEAKEIFIYCGRALQKRRQYREYKRMRSRVPREAFDADPAEGDAELMAKLELNKKLARKREKEILKRHCRMQKDLTKTDVQTEDKTRVTSSFFESCEDEVNSSEDVHSTAGPSNEPMDHSNSIEEQNNNFENHETCLDNIIVKVKEEPIEIPVNIQYKGDVSLVIEISDSESSDDEETVL